MSRRTQAQRRAETEFALLGAAAELVVESGVGSLTLARVGERAGYSRGIITHHFGSKQALLNALARSTQQGFLPALADLPIGLEHLLALIEGYVRALPSLGSAGRAFLMLWAESATRADIAPSFREHDERFRADVRQDVLAGVAAGSIRADVDPDLVAVAVVGQLRGLGLEYLLDPDAVPLHVLGPFVADQWARALVTQSG